MTNVLPTITLYQPWASWIMRKWKTIDTRTHSRFSCLRNKTILIHAGQRTDDSDLTTKNPYLTQEQISYNPDEMINGYILGSAYIYDFRLLKDSDSKSSLIDCESTQRYGLFLEDIKQFKEPILCKGEMGIWYYDLDNMQKVKKPTVTMNTLF